MPADVTLTPNDYHVLSRIPIEWWDENVTGAEIAQTLRLSSGDVLRRIARLVRLGLAERRHAATGPVTSEIRRIGKL